MTCDDCKRIDEEAKKRPLRCKLGFHSHKRHCSHDYIPTCKFCGYKFNEDSQGGYWSKPYD